MAMSGSSGGGPMGDINVTPLVDVMLVLLIIFMVTAPMMNSGVDIQLPKEQAPPIKHDTDKQMTLSIDKNLQYGIDSGDGSPPSHWKAEEMPDKLKDIAKANPDQSVFLQADGTVPYADVAFLLAAAKTAGITKVGLVFDPTASKEDAKP
jgi:biopolymer transport protein TolR